MIKYRSPKFFIIRSAVINRILFLISYSCFLFCSMNLNPGFYFVRQRTKRSFMICTGEKSKCSIQETGQSSVLMQRTSVCRQERFGRQEEWNIHQLLSFDNEATWQWSHFQMSEVHKSKRELTLHNFCLFHSALKCQSEVDTRNSTAQLNERLVNHSNKNSALEKRLTYREKNTLYVNMWKAAYEYLIF